MMLELLDVEVAGRRSACQGGASDVGLVSCALDGHGRSSMLMQGRNLLDVLWKEKGLGSG